jgi:Protein of unknown function (DUF3017)
VVVSDHFRRGTMLISAVMMLAAVARLVLPERRVGMLAMRGRTVDVLVLTMLALSIASVAVGVSPPR